MTTYTLVNNPKESRRPASPGPEEDGVSGVTGRARKGRKEGFSDGGREGAVGDYTIIQITAGYNLVADVSRSTMPTTHRSVWVCVCTCVCVCVHTCKDFQRPSSSHRAQTEQRTKKKTKKTKQQDSGLGKLAFFFESMCEIRRQSLFSSR